MQKGRELQQKRERKAVEKGGKNNREGREEQWKREEKGSRRGEKL